MTRRLFAALAACSLCTAFGAQADDTILPGRNATERVQNWTFTGLSEAALNDKTKTLNARIVDLEVDSTSPPRFSGALVKNGGPHNGGWWWYHDLTERQLNDLTDAKNARIVDLEVYRRNGALRFAVVLKENTGAAKTGWYWFFGQSAASLKAKYDDLGMRLIDIERYRDGDRDRFAAVMVDNRGARETGWFWFQGQTQAQLAARLAEKNMRPIDIERHTDGGSSRFDVIMVPYADGTQGTWYYHGMAQADVAIMARRHGARVIDTEPRGNGTVDVIYLNNGIEKTGHCGGVLAHFGDSVAALMKARAIPGAQVAVVRQGRLVYSCALGMADLAKGDKMTPDHRMRIMSVSKPITSSAIRQLEADGKLSRQDKMLDALGARAPAGPFADGRMADVTVQHLLDHRAGFDNTAPYDPMVNQPAAAADMGENTPLGCREIMGHAITTFPLATAPGGTYDYSNLGYCILQQIVAANGAGTYQHYVKRKILTPAGVTGMSIGNGRLAARAADEAMHYDVPFGADRTSPYPQDAGPMPRPYTYVVEAMAGHGGWLASANDLVRYAAFTPMRPYGSSAITHYGSLSGTKSVLMEYGGAYVAVLFNASPTPQAGETSFEQGTFGPMVTSAVDKVTSWPARDLWQNYGYGQN